MFAAYKTLSHADAGKEDVKQDWLSNTSFKPGDAQVLHQLHSQQVQDADGQDLSALSDRITVSEDNSKREDSKSTIHITDSDTDYTSEEETKRHKKKKKKEKHKSRKHKKEKYKSKKRYKSRSRSPRHRSKSPHRKRSRSPHTRRRSKSPRRSRSRSPQSRQKLPKSRNRSKSPKSKRRSRSPISLSEHTIALKPTLQEKKTFIEEGQGRAEVLLYEIISTSDPHNFGYGSIYKMHIPKYRRLTWCCLGTLDGKFVSVESDGKHNKNAPTRYCSKEFVKEHRKMKCERMSRDKNRSFSTYDYMTAPYLEFEYDTATAGVNSQIGGKGHTKANDVYNPLGVYDSGTAAYIQGKGREESSSTAEETSPYNLQQQRTAAYNARLGTEPHNIELWLEFISYQDELSEFTDLERSKTEVERKKISDKALTEIKLSIFEKAIAKNPSSIKLKVAELNTGKQVWEKETLTEKWNKLLFTHANSAEVWKSYILYVQSQISTFTVGECMKVYARCLKTLNSIKQGSLVSHKCLPNTEEEMMNIFILMCHMLKQANLVEKSISMFQGLIEFTLFSPGALEEASFKDKIELFEAFWDGPFARVGEEGALGWNQFVESKGETAPISVERSLEEEEALEEDLIESHTGRHPTWIALETSRMSRHWLPWRPGEGETEEDCEDPERLVLSDDITPYLFCIQNEELLLKLVLNFVCSLASSGSFNTLQNLCCLDIILIRQFEDTLSVDCACKNKVFEMSGRLANAVGLLGYVENLLSHCLRRSWSNLDYRTVLAAILVNFKLSDYLVVRGGLDMKEKKRRDKEVKKFVKNMLKEEHNRNNLSLWESYVRLEYVLQNVDEARKVFDGVLMNQPKFDKTLAGLLSHPSTLKLYRTGVELELCSPFRQKCLYPGDSRIRILNVLTSLVLDGGYDPSTDKLSQISILKAKRIYHDLFETLQSDLSHFTNVPSNAANILYGNSIVHLVVCYSILQYLITDVQSACDIIIEIQTKLEVIVQSESTKCDDVMVTHINQCAELLTEFQISLLRHHTHCCVSPLRLLRQPLTSSLQSYPTNVRLLRVYIELENNVHVVGRVRRLFHELTAKCGDPVVWLYAVMAELNRLGHRARGNQYGDLGWFNSSPMVECGLTNQIRAWFEKAVNHSESQHCVLMWRLYFNFEINQGQHDSAKSVFLRGLQHCPWAKSLYMDYIQYFPDELESMTNLMSEKELRLRTPQEELDLLMANKPSALPDKAESEEDD